MRKRLAVIRNLATAAAAAGFFLSAAGQAIRMEVGEFKVGSGPDHVFTPAMNEPQFKRYSEVLLLDEAQMMVAEQMLEQYTLKFRSEADAVREEIREVREEVMATGDWSIYGEEMNPIFERWEATRNGLSDELIERLRSLLHDDQMERWPVFEREKRRTELMQPLKVPLGRRGCRCHSSSPWNSALTEAQRPT